jgi:hypothetical protein
MSFGQTDTRLNSHIDELRAGRSRGQARRARPSPLHGGLSSHTLHLQDRLGVRFVEVGLHLMVRARRAAPTPRYQTGALRPSSAAHGR